MPKFCKYCGKQLKEEFTAANGYTGIGPCDCATVKKIAELELVLKDLDKQMNKLNQKDREIREQIWNLKKEVKYI